MSNKKEGQEETVILSDVVREIQNAEMVLIGLGEEFDHLKKLRTFPGYLAGRDLLEDSALGWMIPAWNVMYESEDQSIVCGLQKLADLLAGKNYFVISTSTNDMIKKIAWHENRLVMPCGGCSMKQCANRCENGLMEVTPMDWTQMKAFKRSVSQSDISQITPQKFDLGICPDCGSPLILNNVYTEHYDENGYLKQWGMYTKWLQGTLNRKLLILELGVGMQYPSVIRWPFEKIAFYNQKAVFYRVNEKLYQLSEDLKEKGISVPKNVIDWLDNL